MRHAVILAGGSGLRAGGEIPKQFRLLNGIPVLWWSVKAFHEADPDTRIRLVLHPGFFDLWDILYSEMPEEERSISYELVCGGRDRLESVKNGLSSIENPEGSLIAIHDAARPLVSVPMIRRGWEAAATTRAAIPVIPMTDSIRKLTGREESGIGRHENGEASIALDRSEYVRVQTPQVFEGGLLKRAYSAPLSPAMTDDASVVEAAGFPVSLYDGEETNIKITNPLDFRIATVLMNS